jgi:hypothetical protein
MIDRQEEFKQERNEAIKSNDIEKIKTFLKRHGIKFVGTDEEILKAIKNSPVWD